MCNAAESLVVHEAVADEFLPRGRATRCVEQGVELVGDAGARARVRRRWARRPTTTSGASSSALKMSVAVVPSLDAAIDHVNRFGTGHTEAILTRDLAAAAPVHRRGRRRQPSS